MAKRGQNEGSIYKRKDGRWTAVVNLGFKDGKRWRKSYYGDTRKEVQDQLNAGLQAHAAGLPVAPERQTIQQYLDRWLEDCVKPTVRYSTFSSYTRLVAKHIAPILGKIILTKLSPQDIQKFMNDRLNTGLSGRTVQYLHAILRSALNQALLWGLVQRNVATLTEPPRVQHHEIQPFTPDEAREFLTGIQGDRLEALFSVALALGMRQGEALGLMWKDVDLEAGTIFVRHALQRVKGALCVIETKTRRSRRQINLPQMLVSALYAHRERQILEREMAGSRWVESAFVFTSTVGTPLDTCNVSHRFHRILLALGMRRIRFHDLRHTCASLLLAQGVHPRLVMETLGHSQISLTMDTYSHVFPELKREVANQMEAMLSPVAVSLAVKLKNQQLN